MFVIDKYVLVYAYVPEYFLSRKNLSHYRNLYNYNRDFEED